MNNVALAAPCTTLLPIDLTRGGSQFTFHGHTDVKELSLYVQDTITKGSWSFNLGVRGDIYRGLSSANQAEPRLGIAYNIWKPQTGASFSGVWRRHRTSFWKPSGQASWRRRASGMNLYANRTPG